LHSALVVQMELQVPLAHLYMPQSRISDAWHDPSPSQARVVFIAVGPEHVDVPHTVVDEYVVQVPKPSHTPVVPQVDVAALVHNACPWPAAIGEHMPTWAVKLQARQAPPQAVLQQTPSAQWTDAHSMSPMQLAPFGLRPHILLTHFRPATQSASLAHEGKHCDVAALHEYGAQMVDAPSLQWPTPSHVYVSVTASPRHVPALQVVPTS
jgi:hypothetical protein